MDSVTTGSSVITDVKKELIRAMQFFSTEASWFLQEKIRIPIESGVTEYEIDPFFLGITTDLFYMIDSSMPKNGYSLKLVPYSTLLSFQNSSDDFWAGTVINTGNPRVAAVDPATSLLHVAPEPSTDTGAIEFNILLNDGVPTFQYVDGAWVFYYPNTEDEVDDDFENVWLSEAYDLIVYRAISQLLFGPYGGSDESAKKANDFDRMAQQEMNRIRTKHNKKFFALSIAKNI